MTTSKPVSEPNPMTLRRQLADDIIEADFDTEHPEDFAERAGELIAAHERHIAALTRKQTIEECARLCEKPAADPSPQASPEPRAALIAAIATEILAAYDAKPSFLNGSKWELGIKYAELFAEKALKVMESRVTAPVHDPEWKRLRLTAWENRALKAESALKDLTEMVEFGEQHHPKDFWRFIFGEPGSGFRHAAYRAAVNVLHEQIFNPAALASPPQIAQRWTDQNLYDAYVCGCEDDCLPEPMSMTMFLAQFTGGK